MKPFHSFDAFQASIVNSLSLDKGISGGADEPGARLLFVSHDRRYLSLCHYTDIPARCLRPSRVRR
jgi:hypothetical protein